VRVLEVSSSSSSTVPKPDSTPTGDVSSSVFDPRRRLVIWSAWSLSGTFHGSFVSVKSDVARCRLPIGSSPSSAPCKPSE